MTPAERKSLDRLHEALDREADVEMAIRRAARAAFPVDLEAQETERVILRRLYRDHIQVSGAI